MSSVTFCAEAPELRILLGFIVGIPFGIAAAAGAYRLVSQLGSGSIMRYFRRASALLALIGVTSSFIVFIGGPCAFAGGGSGRGGYVGYYSNTPTTLAEGLKMVWVVAIFLSLFFALILSGRGSSSARDSA